MSDNPDLKWLPLAGALDWLRDYIKLKIAKINLRGALADGSVAARGIRLRDGKLVRIPKYVWSGHIGWSANRVVKLTDEYQNVEVHPLQCDRFVCQFLEKSGVPGGAKVKELRPQAPVPRAEQKKATNTKHVKWISMAFKIAREKTCPKYRGKPNVSEIARRISKKDDVEEGEDTIRVFLARNKDKWMPKT